jgi:hypothetical protein
VERIDADEAGEVAVVRVVRVARVGKMAKVDKADNNSDRRRIEPLTHPLKHQHPRPAMPTVRTDGRRAVDVEAASVAPGPRAVT